MADITSNLTGYWAFDDNTGLTAMDSSGNGNNGTLTGTGLGWTNGRVGYAVDLPGGNGNYVDVGDNVLFEINGNALTVAAWVKADTVPTGGATRQFIVTKGGNGGGSFEWELEFLDTGDKFRSNVYNTGSGGYLTADSVMSPVVNSWYHVVFVYDNTVPSLSLYVNGAFESVDTTVTGSIHTTRTSSLNIGRRQDGAESEWDGQIDEVRIYQRALTQEDVSALHTFHTVSPRRNTLRPAPFKPGNAR